MEKRRTKRYPRRLSVRYGERDLTRSGITCDVSCDGAFVMGSYLPSINSRIHLQLFTGPETFLFFEGVVRRHRLVPAQLRQLEPSGFGVRFLAPGELVTDLVPRAPADNRFEVVFHDPLQLRMAFDQEIRFGGVFVRTERVLDRDASVQVEMRLEFAGRKLDFKARVVQAMSATVHGLALAFDDPAAVERELRPHMAVTSGRVG